MRDIIKDQIVYPSDRAERPMHSWPLDINTYPCVEYVPFYRCPFCMGLYSLKSDAEACYNNALRMAPIANIGDIFTVDPRYTWFNGDEKWVAQRGKSHHGYDAMSFYYVITAIVPEVTDYSSVSRHRLQYHIATKAMTGENGHEHGYEYPDTLKHRIVIDPAAVPHIVEDSRDLLGKVYEHYLTN